MRGKIIKVIIGMGILASPVLGSGMAGASASSIVTNGSFESGSYTSGSGYNTLYAGTASASAIDGWTVVKGSVDWIGSLWAAEQGVHSIDLNGNSQGAVSQVLATTPGTTYGVSFYLAGNFDGSKQYPARMAMVAAKPSGGGTADATAMYKVFEPTNWGPQNMGWTREVFTFTASTSSTALTFMGDPMTGAYGSVLDNVSAVPVATSGAQCKAGGWMDLNNPSTLQPFMNQGMCVSYFASSAQVPIGR